MHLYKYTYHNQFFELSGEHNQNILRLWFDMYNIFLNLKNEPRYSNDIDRLYHRMRIIIGRNYSVPELKVVCYRKILNFSSIRRSKVYLIDKIIEECSMEYELSNRIEWGIDRTPDHIRILNNTETDHDIIPVQLSNHYDKSPNFHFNIIFELIDTPETETPENGICSICYEIKDHTKFIEYNCKHELCGSCAKQILLSNTSIITGPTCAFCREPVKQIRIKNQEVYDEICGKTYFV